MNVSVLPLLMAAKQPFTFITQLAGRLFAAPQPYPATITLADGRVFHQHRFQKWRYRSPNLGPAKYQNWATLWPKLSDETRKQYEALKP